MQNKKPLDLSLNNFSRDSPEQYAKSRFDGNGSIAIASPKNGNSEAEELKSKVPGKDSNDMDQDNFVKFRPYDFAGPAFSQGDIPQLSNKLLSENLERKRSLGDSPGHSPDMHVSKTIGYGVKQDRSDTKSALSPSPRNKKKIVDTEYEDKNSMICRFCGGKTCDQENWLKITRPAIKGLNSNWINEDIVASQRLSKRLIKEFDIITQLKSHKIGVIVNLQEPGEHPLCGDGIDKKWGFSYSSEDLNKHGIATYHLHWEDLKTVSVDHLLKNVKIICSELKHGKKILVHCHAGRGRTGMVICCVLIYRYFMAGKEAIELFQKNREGKCLEKSTQQNNILDFEKCKFGSNEGINTLALTFADKEVSLDMVVENQRRLYTINHNSFEFHTPRIIFQTLDRLCHLKEDGKATTSGILNSFLNCDLDGNSWTRDDEEKLKRLKSDFNARKKDLISTIDDPRFLAQLLLDFLQSLAQPLIYSTFYIEFKAMLAYPDLMLEFVRAQMPRMVEFKENIYLTLDFIAKSFNVLIGKNPDQTKLKMLRLVLLRLSIALNQLNMHSFFYSRNVILHKDYTDLAMTDKLTSLLYIWVTEYDEQDREHFKALSSPLPKLHRKIISQNGRAGYGVTDNFLSKSLQKTMNTKPRQKGDSPKNLTLDQPDNTVAQSNNQRVITEEDDHHSHSEMSESRLDSFPEDIKAFIPYFIDMTYEEQNLIIKQLNAIRNGGAMSP